MHYKQRGANKLRDQAGFFVSLAAQGNGSGDCKSAYRGNAQIYLVHNRFFVHCKREDEYNKRKKRYRYEAYDKVKDNGNLIEHAIAYVAALFHKNSASYYCQNSNSKHCHHASGMQN